MAKHQFGNKSLKDMFESILKVFVCENLCNFQNVTLKLGWQDL